MMKVLKNTSVFWNCFLSYLIMLGMAILVSIALYFFSYEIISEQNEKVNLTMLEKIQTEIDDYFETARRTVISIRLDSDVKKAVKVDGDFSIGDREMLYNIYRNILSQSVASDGFSRIFIYFFKGDTVVSEEGHMSGELFYDLYYKNDFPSFEEFREYIGGRWGGDIVSVEDSEGENEILFLQNSFPGANGTQEATFGIGISDTTIFNWMQERKWDETTELMLVGKDGILCSDGDLGSLMEQEGTLDVCMVPGIQLIEIGGADYQLVSVASEAGKLHYVALTPVGNIKQGARKIQIFMVAGLLLCLTVGIFVAYVLTGINYNPLRHTMDLFGGYKRKKGELNEYGWLQNQTIQFLDEHREVKRRFYDNEKVLRSQYLYRLITLPYDVKNRNMVDFSLDPSFRRPVNMVMLMYLNSEDEKQWAVEMETGLFRFIIMNVMEELIDKRYGLEMVDVKDSIVCVLNGEKEAFESREELESILDQFQKFMRERMKTMVSVFCGSTQNGLEGIYQSYLTARETSEYRLQMKEQQIIWYDDVKNRQSLYEYPIETEQKIINAIKAGQENSASQWVDEVIRHNFRSREITFMMKKSLLSDLFGTVIKGAEKGGGTQFIMDIINERSLPEEPEEKIAIDFFHEIIHRICDDIRKNETARRENKQFGKQVMEYVQQNYQDPDLNISITALHFNITPSYLSALFKEQTGQSLLEYINHTRVEHVKKLLEEGRNLTEICNMTGFRSSGALIRVFKKETGVTPGQMKKMNEE